MKTIKQAAKEYANTKAKVVVGGTEITNTIDDLNLYSQTDFMAGAKFAQEFISVEDELPPAKKQVIAKLISENGKEYKTMAIYIPPRTILAEDFMMNHDDSDFYEYDEEKDTYYVFEGWWEWQTVTDVNWKIYDKVIGWRPIERK